MSRKVLDQIKVLNIEKRRYPNKHYVYVLEVYWSIGSVNTIYRRYSQFFDFQLSLILHFPFEGGQKSPENRIIPFLPGKKLIGRSHVRDVAQQRLGPISEYCTKLIELPTELSQCKMVTEFFEPTDEDIHPTREKKKSTKNSEIQIISDPVLLEQWVAIGDFKATKNSECNLKEGDVVDVVEKNINGWWFIDNQGNQGWVPASYLESDTTRDEDQAERCVKGEEEEYITINSYIAQASDELSFDRGVIMLVAQKNYNGWWVCIYIAKEGLAPAAYLEPNTQNISMTGRSTSSHRNAQNSLHSNRKIQSSASLNAIPNLNSTPKTQKSQNQPVIDSSAENTRGGESRQFLPRRHSIVQQAIIKNKERAESGFQDNDIPAIADYIAIADYETTETDCLSFHENQVIEIVEKTNDVWWWANLNGSVGWVPCSYMKKDDVKKYQNQKSPALLVKKSDLLNIKPKQCRAMENFASGQSRDTLSFTKGETFDLIEKSPTGWWYIKNNRGEEGWGPSEYLKDEDGVKVIRPAPVAPIKKSVNSNNVQTKDNLNNAISNQNKHKSFGDPFFTDNFNTTVKTSSFNTKNSFTKSTENDNINRQLISKERNNPSIPNVANPLKLSDSTKGPEIPKNPRPSLKGTQPVLPDRPGRIKDQPRSNKVDYSESRPFKFPGPPLPPNRTSASPIASSLQNELNNSSSNSSRLMSSKSIPDNLSNIPTNNIVLLKNSLQKSTTITNQPTKNTTITNQPAKVKVGGNNRLQELVPRSQDDISIARTQNFTVKPGESTTTNKVIATNIKTNNVNNQLADILAMRSQNSEANSSQAHLKSITKPTGLKPITPNLAGKPMITQPNNVSKPNPPTKPRINSGNKPTIAQIQANSPSVKQIFPNKPLLKPALTTKPQLPTGSKPQITPNTNTTTDNLYIATRHYTSESDDCLSLNQGELVEVLEFENEDWWWIKINGKEGWGPAAILKKQAKINNTSKQTNFKVTLEAFTAEYDESLTFRKGDYVEVLEEDTNGVGWTWAKIGNEEGWVPTNLIGNAS